MTVYFHRCECGRNVPSDEAFSGTGNEYKVIHCFSCGKSSSVDMAVFTILRENRSVKQIPWQAT